MHIKDSVINRSAIAHGDMHVYVPEIKMDTPPEILREYLEAYGRNLEESKMHIKELNRQAELDKQERNRLQKENDVLDSNLHRRKKSGRTIITGIAILVVVSFFSGIYSQKSMITNLHDENKSLHIQLNTTLDSLSKLQREKRDIYAQLDMALNQANKNQAEISILQRENMNLRSQLDSLNIPGDVSINVVIHITSYYSYIRAVLFKSADNTSDADVIGQIAGSSEDLQANSTLKINGCTTFRIEAQAKRSSSSSWTMYDNETFTLCSAAESKRIDMYV